MFKSVQLDPSDDSPEGQILGEPEASHRESTRGKESSEASKENSSVAAPRPPSESTFTDPEPFALPSLPSTFKCLQFDSVLQFAYMIHPLLRSGKTDLYDWQAASNLLITNPGFIASNPLEYYLVANNGSGKDSFVIALPVLYFLCCKVRHRVVITSKDSKQLRNQTFPNLKSLGDAVNRFCWETGLMPAGKEFVEIKQDHLVCPTTGGDCILFVTDEPARAEGYHPASDHPDASLILITNEAKSIDKAMFQAQRRCTGYSRWVLVSSSGFDSGYFYERTQAAVTWPAPYVPRKPYVRYVTAYECKHISPEEIENARKELEPWLFESIYLSKFSSLGGEFVISRNLLNDLKASPPEPDKGKNLERVAGLDLSLGGDETVLVVREGNRVIDIKAWREKNAVRLESDILAYLKNTYGSSPLDLNVDCGGLGKPIFQHLRNASPINFTWHECLNNSRAWRPTLYRSSGTEDYFHVRTLVTRKLVILPFTNDLLLDQLSGRRYVTTEGKLKLEDKAEARARGEKSPDQADALVLAFRRYKFNELNAIVSNALRPTTVSATSGIITSDKDLANWYASRPALNSPAKPKHPLHPSKLLSKIYASPSRF